MKKSIAIVAALAVAALSVPVISGCSASVGYIKKTDVSGNEYYSVSVDGNASALRGELVIPSQYEGLPVKEIEATAFSNAMYTKITIPASIETVGTAAFSYNYALEEVVFEEGSALEEIAWGMFGYCGKLQKINIPDSVKIIDGFAFYNCAFKTIEFPKELERINVKAFEGCFSLTELTFPQTLQKIGNFAFFGCESLTSLVLPDSLIETQEPTLDENGNEVKDENGNTVTEFVPAIGVAAFHTCTSLKSIKVGAGVTVLESGVFGYCTALEEIYLPAGLKTIYGAIMNGSDIIVGHAFHNDGALSHIYFGGTQEQWQEVKTENDSVSSNGVEYSNKAVLNATVTFGAEY